MSVADASGRTATSGLWRRMGLLSFAGLLLALAAGGTTDAGARAAVTVDGRTIVVEGGSSQSISSVDGAQVIVVDGEKITIEPGRITIDGETRRLGDFKKLRIEMRQGKPAVTVDGEPL